MADKSIKDEADEIADAIVSVAKKLHSEASEGEKPRVLDIAAGVVSEALHRRERAK